jgi:hypothetical protein
MASRASQTNGFSVMYEMLRIDRCFAFLAMMVMFIKIAKGQDPHAIGIESMKIWYNPALKTDKNPLVNVNYRKVNFPKLLAYNSKSVTLELPLSSADELNDDNIRFASLSVGINVDNAGNAVNSLMNASTAMLGFAYAMPLDYNNTYVAIGLQANCSFNKIENDQVIPYLAKSDQAGALNWSLQMDPFRSGYNYKYFTVSTGISFFHSGEKSQWYFGGSARNFNHPYTEWDYANRLPTAYGIQGGCTIVVSPVLQVSTFGNFYWQNGPVTMMHGQFLGISAFRAINVSDSSSFTVSLGLGMRPADGLIPTASVRYRKSLFTVYYELNPPGLASKNYYRKALDFSYRLNF